MGVSCSGGLGREAETAGKAPVRVTLIYSNAELSGLPGKRQIVFRETAFGEMISTEYMIADCDKKRCSSLQKKINLYRGVKCVGSFGKELDLLAKTWLEHPEVVLIYAGDRKLNAYSVLKRIKEVTPDVKVVFYSEQNDFAADASEWGADYFLPLPADDIQIGKLIFRYIGINN